MAYALAATHKMKRVFHVEHPSKSVVRSRLKRYSNDGVFASSGVVSNFATCVMMIVSGVYGSCGKVSLGNFPVKPFMKAETIGFLTPRVSANSLRVPRNFLQRSTTAFPFGMSISIGFNTGPLAGFSQGNVGPSPSFLDPDEARGGVPSLGRSRLFARPSQNCTVLKTALKTVRTWRGTSTRPKTPKEKNRRPTVPLLVTRLQETQETLAVRDKRGSKYTVACRAQSAVAALDCSLARELALETPRKGTQDPTP